MNEQHVAQLASLAGYLAKRRRQWLSSAMRASSYSTKRDELIAHCRQFGMWLEAVEAALVDDSGMRRRWLRDGVEPSPPTSANPLPSVTDTGEGNP